MLVEKFQAIGPMEDAVRAGKYTVIIFRLSRQWRMPGGHENIKAIIFSRLSGQWRMPRGH